ncbi:MAG: S-layer homology domain-containing protein [Clostridia bacterium]|nr:S-layer homology domain-containing protein [Clostridia bacterium]
MKRKFYSMINFIVMFIFISTIFCSTAVAATFKDLSTSHWAYKYITALTNNHVINGYTDGTFKPEGTITNAEFIKLVVMAALPDWIDIEDAESNLNHWAGKYIWIAERYGVISSGSIQLSNIDNPITRIEMVRIISRADISMKGSSMASNEKVKFNDVLSLNNDDLLLLKHAVSKGLITGYTDNTFKPYHNMSRAEAATMIYRFQN